MTKDFNYHLTGTGWAEVFFTSDTQNIKFEISYLNDPLSDLFEALYKLASNKSDKEKILFPEEPGQHSLMIYKQDNDVIKVEIYWSDEWEVISNTFKTISKKELVYTDSDTLKNFIAIICTGIDSLLERLTLTDYNQKWNLFEFPSNSYQKLKQVLD